MRNNTSVRLALPPTWEAPDCLFSYTEYSKGDPRMFADTYTRHLLNRGTVITYGLGEEPWQWLKDHKIKFKLERTDEHEEDTGSSMFIHLPTVEIAVKFKLLFCSK